MATWRLNRAALLGRLAEIKVEPHLGGEEEALQRISLASVLPVLANINHESEYKLCHSLAGHLLGKAPEPEAIDWDDLLDDAIADPEENGHVPVQP